MILDTLQVSLLKTQWQDYNTAKEAYVPFPALGPLVETMHNSNHSQTHVSISLPFPYQDIRILIDDTLDNETIKAE